MVELSQMTIKEDLRDYDRVREQNGRLRDFARWVETWVSQPIGAFSVDALDGLFGMARDKLANLEK